MTILIDDQTVWLPIPIATIPTRRKACQDNPEFVAWQIAEFLDRAEKQIAAKGEGPR